MHCKYTLPPNWRSTSILHETVLAWAWPESSHNMSPSPRRLVYPVQPPCCAAHRRSEPPESHLSRSDELFGNTTSKRTSRSVFQHNTPCCRPAANPKFFPLATSTATHTACWRSTRPCCGSPGRSSRWRDAPWCPTRPSASAVWTVPRSFF